MKLLLTAVTVLISSVIFGQTTASYKYVYVPLKFTKFKRNNQYNLNNTLVAALEKKNYSVLRDSPEKWSMAMGENSCSVLSADFIENGTLLKNRAVLEFRDCNGKIVQSVQGETTYKEYDRGFQDVLSKTLKQVPDSNPSNQIASSPSSPALSTERKHTALPVNTSNNIKEVARDTFRNGSKTYSKISTSPQEFILVEEGSSVAFATFRNSTKEGVFRVRLNDGTQTLGYLEGNQLVIETEEADRSLKKIIFRK